MDPQYTIDYSLILSVCVCSLEIPLEAEILLECSAVNTLLLVCPHRLILLKLFLLLNFLKEFTNGVTVRILLWRSTWLLLKTVPEGGILAQWLSYLLRQTWALLLLLLVHAKLLGHHAHWRGHLEVVVSQLTTSTFVLVKLKSKGRRGHDLRCLKLEHVRVLSWRLVDRTTDRISNEAWLL